jgi:hypothetical protein
MERSDENDVIELLTNTDGARRRRVWCLMDGRGYAHQRLRWFQNSRSERMIRYGGADTRARGWWDAALRNASTRVREKYPLSMGRRIFGRTAATTVWRSQR